MYKTPISANDLAPVFYVKLSSLVWCYTITRWRILFPDKWTVWKTFGEGVVHYNHTTVLHDLIYHILSTWTIAFPWLSKNISNETSSRLDYFLPSSLSRGLVHTLYIQIFWRAPRHADTDEYHHDVLSYLSIKIPHISKKWTLHSPIDPEKESIQN